MGLRDVLLVVRCLLIEPNPDSALNEEAGRLLQVGRASLCGDDSLRFMILLLMFALLEQHRRTTNNLPAMRA